MQKGYVNLLMWKFKDIGWREVNQEILLAELQADGRGDRLAFIIALRNLQDLDRKRRAYERRFCGLFSDGLFEDTFSFIDGAPDERFLDELEWQDIVRRLPLPARRLAEFAKIEAERFEDVPHGVWQLQSLMELRRRIKRRYIEWDRDHSEQSYLRARATLTAALRQHGGKRRKATDTRQR